MEKALNRKKKNRNRKKRILNKTKKAVAKKNRNHLAIAKKRASRLEQEEKEQIEYDLKKAKKATEEAAKRELTMHHKAAVNDLKRRMGKMSVTVKGFGEFN